MHACNWLVAAALVAVLGGCSREDAATEQAEEQRTGGLPADNVFSDQVRSLEKAQDVQSTLDNAAARTRESVERQERP